MLCQNALGVTLARWSGLPPASGLLVGTVSLIGGHGTTIAWAPQFAQEHGVANALEIGIAAATFGLILASASGGPIARFLIRRHRLVVPGSGAAKLDQAADSHTDAATDADAAATGRDEALIRSHDFLGAVLAINVCIILGSILQEVIRDLGLFLPLFVPCLIVGILLSNLLPQLGSWLPFGWPARSAAIDLIAEIALGTFLAMSLMTIQFWTLVDLAGPLLLILLAQFLLALLINLFLVFPLLGRSYDAAVIAAGFSGFTLGMANMTAVTQKFGPSTKAFIVLPLVSAFFIDLLNAVMIPYFLGRV
jgi:ESS family glutamate:Na+ symporter